MTRRCTAIVVCAALVALTPRAHAQDVDDPSTDAGCVTDSSRGVVDGPLSVGLLEGELGVARRLCPRTQLGLGANALLIADFDAFYGDVRVSGVLWASWAAAARDELFVTLEAFRYQTVISSIVADHVGLGHLSFGKTRAHLVRDDFRMGTSIRFVLPTAVGLYDNAWPLAADLLAEVEWLASSRVQFHARAGGLGSIALTGGPAAPEAAVVLGGGTVLRALRWLAFVVEVDSSYGRAALLDHLALGGGLRLGFGDHFGAELGATFPIAGRERARGAAMLRATWRP